MEGGESTVGFSRAKTPRKVGKNSHHPPPQKKKLKTITKEPLLTPFRTMRNTVTMSTLITPLNGEGKLVKKNASFEAIGASPHNDEVDFSTVMVDLLDDQARVFTTRESHYVDYVAWFENDELKAVVGGYCLCDTHYYKVGGATIAFVRPQT